MHGVAYGAGRFVIIGQDTVADTTLEWWTSEDGLTWTEHRQILPGSFVSNTKIHYLNGRFVFFGYRQDDGEYVYSSTDASTWLESKVKSKADVDLFAPTEFDWGDNLYLAANWNFNVTLGASRDLARWTFDPLVDTKDNAFADVAFGGGRWLVTIRRSTVGSRVSQLFGSDDGRNWSLLVTLDVQGFIDGHRLSYGRGVWILNSNMLWASPGTQGA